MTRMRDPGRPPQLDLPPVDDTVAEGDCRPFCLPKMERGLYIAASGMPTELVRQDQLANDLANASTPGYKADRSAQSSFGDLLLSNTATGQTIGPLGLGVQIAETKTDLAQGPLVQTGGPLDVPPGPGFLAVQTAQGTRYTRDGQLAVDAKGGLTTATADRCSTRRGSRSGRRARRRSRDRRRRHDHRRRHDARQARDRLPHAVKQATRSSRAPPAPHRPARPSSRARSRVRDTNPARVMVDMIVSLRAYEASQKVIRSIDETLQRGIQSGGAA